MRLKGYCNRFAPTLSRARHNLMQHMRMRAMYSVKIPDADQGRAEISRNVVEFVKNQHEEWSAIFEC